MYALSEDDVIKVRWRWSAMGITAYVVRHYVTRLLVGTVTNEDAAFGIDLSVTPPLTGTMVNTTVKYGLGAQRIWPTPIEDEYFSDTTFSFSLIEPPYLPPQCAAVIRLDPEFRGLKYRGRVFLPFQPQQGLNEGRTWGGDHLTLLESAAQALSTPINLFLLSGSATMFPCIWHRAEESVTTFQVAYPRLQVGTQRRRGHAWRPATIPGWT